MAKHTFKIYEDHDGKWRWRLVNDRTGEVVAESETGYPSDHAATRAVNSMKNNVSTATVVAEGGSDDAFDEMIDRTVYDDHAPDAGENAEGE